MITSYNLAFAFNLATVLGCGLVAGVFFAFSTFVMNALARLQPREGIIAMQSINIAAINPLFMLVLFGTSIACLSLAITSLWQGHQPGTVYRLIGSLSYLIGTVLVTIAFNVPLNNALAQINPDSVEGAKLWAKYLRDWTVWNHIRTLTALVAAALLRLAN